MGDMKCAELHVEYTLHHRYPLQKSNLRKVASESKHLTEEERTMLHNVLGKYYLLFNGMIVTWKNKPGDI